MRLADLRAIVYWKNMGDYLDGRQLSDRPATVDDLIAVLIEEGGEIVTVGDRKDRLAPAIYTGYGRYLVFRLPTEEER